MINSNIAIIFFAIYSVGMSKVCSCFTQIMDNNSKDLGPIITKIDRYGCPTNVTNFKQIGEQVCRVFKCAKKGGIKGIRN